MVALRVLGILGGKARMFYGALFVAAIGAVLVVGWAKGPGRLAFERELAGMTARATGRIERAWWRLDLDAARIDARVTNWRAVATIEQCVEVGFDGGRATRSAVVLCSARLPFQTWWTPLGSREITPGVPFEWPADADGRPRVVLRLPPSGLRWLEAQPDGALADLWRQLDHPVDLIVDAWSTRPERGVIPLVFAPDRPEAALPAALLAGRASTVPTGFLIVGLGAVFWIAFAHAWMADARRAVRWTLALVPLLLLPWWGEWLPTILERMLPDAGEVFSDVTRNVSPVPGALGRATPAGTARLGDAERVWTLETSVYAGTLGRLTLRRPATPPALAPDAALVALIEQVTAQLLARPDAELAALLTRLDAEHRAGRRAASLVFVPAARAAYLDPRRGEAVRRAALAVLDDALTQPRDDPDPKAPAFEAKLAVWASLLDFPVDHIRNRAGWVFEHVGRPVPAAPR
jgi:hypothetical protein